MLKHLYVNYIYKLLGECWCIHTCSWILCFVEKLLELSYLCWNFFIFLFIVQPLGVVHPLRFNSQYFGIIFHNYHFWRKLPNMVLPSIFIQHLIRLSLFRSKSSRCNSVTITLLWQLADEGSGPMPRIAHNEEARQLFRHLWHKLIHKLYQ